jgi:hypothetical protein
MQGDMRIEANQEERSSDSKLKDIVSKLCIIEKYARFVSVRTATVCLLRSPWKEELIKISLTGILESRSTCRIKITEYCCIGGIAYSGHKRAVSGTCMLSQ